MNCPRCTGPMTRVFRALSRADNKTYICSACGRTEGLLQAAGRELPQPAEWPVRVDD